MLPGSIFMFLMERIMVWPWIRSSNLRAPLGYAGGTICDQAYHRCGCCSYVVFDIFRWVCIDFSTMTNFVTDWGPIYLTRSWLMLLAAAQCGLIFLMEGAYTCIIPWVFPLTFIDAASWDFRYFMIVFMFITMPLDFGATIMWCCAPCVAKDDSVHRRECNITRFSNLYEAKFGAGAAGHEHHSQG
jgi:hypothetical protein